MQAGDVIARPESVAQVLVGLAMDTPVYCSRRFETLEVNTLTFTIRASDSSWHPRLPGRPSEPHTDDFIGPALRNESFSSIFQVALY